jgi:hypothetical protein
LRLKSENLPYILALYKLDACYRTELIPTVFEEINVFARLLKGLQSLDLFTPNAVVRK